MSGPVALTLSVVFSVGIFLGFAIGYSSPQMPDPDPDPDPAPEQMMQMMSIYCGEDGCQ